MKMIKAMIRPEKETDVVLALEGAGFPAITKTHVFGRGKQKGLQVGPVHYDELPKLSLMGFPSMTIQSVEGRGKQRGLIQEIDPQIEADRATGDRLVPTPAAYALEHSLPRSVQWVPKRLLTLVVPDEAVEKVVEGIMTVNQTGHIGDGRVFIGPVDEAVRIRTAERGEEAIL